MSQYDRQIATLLRESRRMRPYFTIPSAEGLRCRLNRRGWFYQGLDIEPFDPGKVRVVVEIENVHGGWRDHSALTISALRTMVEVLPERLVERRKAAHSALGPADRIGMSQQMHARLRTALSLGFYEHADFLCGRRPDGTSTAPPRTTPEQWIEDAGYTIVRTSPGFAPLVIDWTGIPFGPDGHLYFATTPDDTVLAVFATDPGPADDERAFVTYFASDALVDFERTERACAMLRICDTIDEVASVLAWSDNGLRAYQTSRVIDAIPARFRLGSPPALTGAPDDAVPVAWDGLDVDNARGLWLQFICGDECSEDRIFVRRCFYGADWTWHNGQRRS